MKKTYCSNKGASSLAYDALWYIYTHIVSSVKSVR